MAMAAFCWAASNAFTLRTPTITQLRPKLQPLYYEEKEIIVDKLSNEQHSVSSLFTNDHDNHVGVDPISVRHTSLPIPEALPGDCDVQAFINENVKLG